MKKILIFTTAQGHLSIAEAIKEKLGDGEFEIKIFRGKFVLNPPYVAMYQFLPSVGSVIFSVSKHDQMVEQLRKIFKLNFRKEVRAQIEEFQPDLIINCFYTYIPSLEEECRNRQIPLLNIITDPLTVHPAMVSHSPAINLVFDKKAVRVLRGYRKDALIEETGWFVGDRFEANYDQAHVRAELGLDPSLLTILIASGSEGTNLILKILPILLFTKNRVQVIVACGGNRALKRMIDQGDKFIAAIKEHNQIVAIGFTKNIEKYMQAADLVVGKAGPNSLFETVATKTPFFAITHISGQEDGNLDIIKNHKLGLVEERYLQMQKLLKAIIDRPSRLDKYKRPIEKLAAFNKLSKVKLLKIVESMI